MAQISDELRDQLNKSLEELKTLRDDIRVRLHLAGMDAKKRWNEELEPRFFQVEKQFKEAGGKASEAAKKAMNDIVDAFKHFRASLGHPDKGGPSDKGGTPA